MEIAIQPRYAEIATRWAQITIERFQKQFPLQKIHQGSLYNSFGFQVQASSEGLQKILITYLNYGKYVDMGVGRGVAVGDRGTSAFSRYRNSGGQLRNYKRKAKKWYSPVIFHEQVMLMHIMADQFGDAATSTIGTIPQKMEISSPIL